MALRLTIDNETHLPDGGPTSFTLTGKRSIEIGRDQFRDWALPDPNRVISGRHCEIKWQDGFYWLVDASRNGTFLNGGEHRVASPARLRDGDRLGIGHYLITVSIDEADQPARALPRAVVPDFIGQGEAPIAPPIDRNLLKPQPPRAAGDDFLDQPIDIPSIEQPAAPPPPPPPSADSSADWLSSIARPAPAPAAMTPALPPATRKPATIPNPWLPTPSPPPASTTPDPPEPEPPRPPAVERPVAVERRPAPDADAEVLRRFARGAGLPEGLLDGKDPGEVAESLGRLVRDMTGHVKALLDARQSAKRIARVADHTMMAALDNNPLKFSPSVDEALAIMFGPPRRGYLDAARCFESSFKDLAEHQMRTFSAMQRAMQMLQQDLEPASIEGSVKEDKGFAAIMGSRGARLWDAYVQRWRARIGRFDDGLVGAFLRDFADCYDDPQKGA